MKPTESIQQANVELVARVGHLISTDFANADQRLFADDFVFHFFNPHLPELAGDHHGLDGLSSLRAPRRGKRCRLPQRGPLNDAVR